MEMSDIQLSSGVIWKLLETKIYGLCKDLITPIPWTIRHGSRFDWINLARSSNFKFSFLSAIFCERRIFLFKQWTRLYHDWGWRWSHCKMDEERSMDTVCETIWSSLFPAWASFLWKITSHRVSLNTSYQFCFEVLKNKISWPDENSLKFWTKFLVISQPKTFAISHRNKLSPISLTSSQAWTKSTT